MKRSITEKLTAWKNNPGRKPLLIRGARQVGKTYSIIEFGKTHFNGNTHNINFEKNPDLYPIFQQNLDSNRILSELELVLGKRIVPGNDLLFFDEIQECPKAIMALRYFFEEKPELHVIAAGSLLEFALKDISFPVGRLQMLVMYPMTFEEFLVSTGKELLAERIKQPDSQFPEVVINMINHEMYNYFIVGGMPECVDAFVNTGSFIDTMQIQTDLIATLRQDFAKYAGHADKRCLNSVLNSVTRKVGEQIKYTHLADDFSPPTIKKAFELLEMARLFSKVRAASPGGIPLGASASEKIFKTIFLDIGLMSNINGFYSDKTVSKQRFASAWNGKMAEQFVGQELRASGNENLYYWVREKRGSSAETDYLIEKEAEVIPVEVKSGKSGKLKSLHLLLNTYSNVKTAYVLTEDKYGEIPEQKIKFRPLFCAANL
ncbi:MAG: ATP-binding protein [Mangrovibacterium sp.]